MAFVLPVALLSGAPSGLPLPQGPLRLIISDVADFNGSLSEGVRHFIQGKPDPGDSLVSAWRKTQVGSKLEDQWGRFFESVSMNWEEIQKLKPTAVGIALLDVGHLEAVLAVETPLAVLPFALPKGEQKTHGGTPYCLVFQGSADGSKDKDRRMGLAWAKVEGCFLLASSERAIKRSIEEAMSAQRFSQGLPGFCYMELDLNALRKDRYFKREFPFGPGEEKGMLKAALRRENGDLVEIRTGGPDSRKTVFAFDAPDAAWAGWEPDGAAFWATFRRGLLEPVHALSDRPQRVMEELPSIKVEAPENRYLQKFSQAKAAPKADSHEEGDLALWKALFSKVPVAHWGYWVDRRGARKLVFPWPREQEQALLEACKATLFRRAGKLRLFTSGPIHEFRAGPEIPLLALKRTGDFLWVAASVQELTQVPEPKPGSGLIRWAHVDFSAVRGESGRWAKLEGPASPERVRPLSDRVLGGLGWMPHVDRMAMERRSSPQGWEERVVFSATKPAK